MGRDSETGGERDLSEALGLNTAPREVSYLAVVAGVLLVGAVATFAISTVAAWPRRASPVEELTISAIDLGAAGELFRRGQFADARAAFGALSRAHPDNARVHDYLARLERVDLDAAVIARARARLALGDPATALAITRDIAANSPLYPDAWALAQKAQDELAHAARTQAEFEREARAAEAAQALAEQEALSTAHPGRQKRPDRAPIQREKRTRKVPTGAPQ